MTRIPDDHLEKVCKIGQSGCCRYVALGPNGFECEKHGSLKKVLDDRVAEGQMRAVGDNCKGL